MGEPQTEISRRGMNETTPSTMSIVSITASRTHRIGKEMRQTREPQGNGRQNLARKAAALTGILWKRRMP